MQVLEHFRWRLVQRFRSLFDAFERLHDLAIRQNALGQEEFCEAFSQLGVPEPEALETFLTMDSKGKQLVSLAELRSALVGTSKEALLWELRCRLMTQGITPDDFSKVKKILEIARRPRHRTVRARRRQPPKKGGQGLYRAGEAVPCEYEGQTPECENEADTVPGTTKEDAAYAWAGNVDVTTGFLPSSSRLSRLDWLQVCAAIGLTLGEAEQLFPMLADLKKGMVNLAEVFTTLRADVAPMVSLERFATRVLTRYGSLQNAFTAFCCDSSTPAEKTALDPATGAVRQALPMMHWSEFHSLAITLAVKDSNATQLWAALTLAQWNVQRDSSPEETGAGELSATAAAAKVECEVMGVTEAIFVKELTTWAPGTALCALRNQVDEHFSELGEFRHALVQTGVVLSVPLSPAELDAALLAVGIPGCNVERVCSAVQSTRRGGQKDSAATLDEVVQALHNLQGSGAQSTVRDDLRSFWQKLHNVQADLEGVPADVVQPQVPDEITETRLQCVSDKSPWRPAGQLRSSASLPSLAGSGGLRSTLRRKSSWRQGLSCCA
jgi:hypothetical protein